MTITPGMVL